MKFPRNSHLLYWFKYAWALGSLENGLIIKLSSPHLVADVCCWLVKEIGPKASVRQIYDFSRKVFSHKVDSLTGVKEILDLELTYLKIGIKASQDTIPVKFFFCTLHFFSFGDRLLKPMYLKIGMFKASQYWSATKNETINSNFLLQSQQREVTKKNWQKFGKSPN